MTIFSNSEYLNIDLEMKQKMKVGHFPLAHFLFGMPASIIVGLAQKLNFVYGLPTRELKYGLCAYQRA